MSLSWWQLPLWIVLCLPWSSVTTARADDAAPVVVWLDGHDTGRARERERALRLELEARAIVLLLVEPSATDAASTPGPGSREALARQTLVRSDADAVLWFEGDATRPVSWLRVVQQRSDAIEQAPLPHPPDAIEPALFAVAAASLLEQLLRAPTANAGPGVEPPDDTQPAPVPAAETATTPAPQAEPLASPPAATAPAAVRPPTSQRPAPADWFVQAGVTLALADVHSDMEAATRPNFDEIFLEQDGRHFFDLDSPWVPDADSFDDYESPEAGIPRGRIPVPGNCSADGKVTGPTDLEDENGDPFTQLEPSRYCVRVADPGLAFVPALRLLVGRWVLPRLALGLLYQWHFGIDPNTFFGNQLFGLHAEYLVLGARGRGGALSLLAALTAGRTETPVSTPNGTSPNALSGPFGASVGALLRLWPSSGFALFASPTAGTRFPASQITLDLSAGVEVPF